MKYLNAQAILPDALVKELQAYIQGGYIYVPAPWWKMDYFEIRFENPSNNKRYFYQLDGEGMRYEIVSFLQAIEKKCTNAYIEQKTSMAISGLIGDYMAERDVSKIIIL